MTKRLAQQRVVDATFDDMAHRAKWGLSRAEKRALPREARLRFTYQRNAAKRDGIPWRLTLGAWWQMWQASGQWTRRGQHCGQFQFGRRDRTQPFDIENAVVMETSVLHRQPRQPYRVRNARA